MAIAEVQRDHRGSSVVTGDDDDRDDGSLLASPYFWVGVLIGLAIWGVVLWAAL
jgi:hypothetical protein